MKDKGKMDYMSAGERERILGTGMARDAGRAIQQRQRANRQLDGVMKDIESTRKKSR